MDAHEGWITSSGREFVVSSTGELLIAVKGPHAWDDDTWTKLIDEVLEYWATRRFRSFLVFSPPARALSTAQRRLMNQRVGPFFMQLERGALMSDSALVRTASKTMIMLLRALGHRGTYNVYKINEHDPCLRWLCEASAFDVADAQALLRRMVNHAGYTSADYGL